MLGVQNSQAKLIIVPSGFGVAGLKQGLSNQMGSGKSRSTADYIERTRHHPIFDGSLMFV